MLKTDTTRGHCPWLRLMYVSMYMRACMKLYLSAFTFISTYMLAYLYTYLNTVCVCVRLPVCTHGYVHIQTSTSYTCEMEPEERVGLRTLTNSVYRDHRKWLGSKNNQIISRLVRFHTKDPLTKPPRSIYVYQNKQIPTNTWSMVMISMCAWSRDVKCITASMVSTFV